MHELYIAHCIADSVHKALPADCAPAAVQRITVRVGKLDAVVPESLCFLFDAIKSDSGLTAAQLRIEEESVQLVCNQCGLDFTIEAPVFLCPRCQSGDVTTLAGRGITLTDISVAE